MAVIRALLLLCLVALVASQATPTVIYTETYAGVSAQTLNIPIPAVDEAGVSVIITSTNGTIDAALNRNAPCLFTYGDEFTLNDCFLQGSGSENITFTGFVPAGAAFLSIVSPAEAEYTVVVNGNVCDDPLAVGPACAVPQTEMTIAATQDEVTYVQLPSFSTADPYVTSFTVSVNTTEELTYSNVVLGSLPTELDDSDTTIELTVDQPVVGAAGIAQPSGQLYYMAFQCADNANCTFSITVTTTNCTAGSYLGYYEDDTDCVAVSDLQFNSAFVALPDSYFDNTDWAYFKLDSSFLGAVGLISIGAIPEVSDGELPALYLRCGNLPTEDAYDSLLLAPESTDNTALYYVGNVVDTCDWFIGFYADSSSQKKGLDMWLGSDCPFDCSGNGECVAHVCECADTWTGNECNTVYAPGQDPDDLEDSTRFWDITEWSPAAWVAVSLLVILIIIVIAQAVGLVVLAKKWDDSRRGAYDKI